MPDSKARITCSKQLDDWQKMRAIFKHGNSSAVTFSWARARLLFDVIAYKVRIRDPESAYLSWTTQSSSFFSVDIPEGGVQTGSELMTLSGCNSQAIRTDHWARYDSLMSVTTVVDTADGGGDRRDKALGAESSRWVDNGSFLIDTTTRQDSLRYHRSQASVRPTLTSTLN